MPATSYSGNGFLNIPYHGIITDSVCILYRLIGRDISDSSISGKHLPQLYGKPAYGTVSSFEIEY